MTRFFRKIPAGVHVMYCLTLLLILSCQNEPSVKSGKQILVPEDDTTVIESGKGIVSVYGQLHFEGVNLLNQNNQHVTLEGMSLFWHQWEGGKYYNYKCLKWLRDDWHCDIIRAAIAVENGGYLEHPNETKQQIFNLIEDCIDLDLYVIVDWHSHAAHETPNAAIEFFSEVSSRYGDRPNVIYEIYNEPLSVSWSADVKPYLDSVIAAIRHFDPDNIIIVGSPRWSQDVDLAANDPIVGENIAYSLHYYAGTHKQWLRDKAQTALDKGLPLWVTEFGMCNSDGDGPIDYEESERWFNFMQKNRISWCKWSVVEKDETSASLHPGASLNGEWKAKDLTESGSFIRNKLREINKRKSASPAN